MNIFDRSGRIWRNTPSLSWDYVFLVLCLFCLIAQCGFYFFLPHNGVFLSVGFLLVLITTFVVLWRQVVRDWVLTIFIFSVLLYWLLAFPPAINGSDDNAAYLIYAKNFYSNVENTMQPLSERRMFSMGGSYALQAPILHWIGQYGLSLVEPAFGLMLFFTIVTSRFVKENKNGHYLVIAVLAAMPLAGSKVLANTSSVFVLSAFSFALIELGKDIFQKRNVNSMQIMLLVILPLAAATFRPTTFPFNALISFMLILVAIYFNIKQTIKIIVFGLVGLSLFFLAAIPYHESSGTYLYPVLGRGFHITAEGYSISESLSFFNHLENFFKVALADPLFLIIGGLVVFFIRNGFPVPKRPILLTVYAVYFFFYFLIVFSTGGLASVRYVFPVSLAVVISLLLLFFDLFQRPVFGRNKWLNLDQKIVFSLLIIAGLIICRLTVGVAVVEKRLKMYSPNDDVKKRIEVVQEILNSNSGSILFVCTGFERFIVDKIERRYFIMDQPGMLSPWIDGGISYEQGLRNFLVLNDIRNIVMNVPQCPVENAKNKYSGWTGLSSLASQRNEHAICNIIKDFDVKLIGSSFMVATKKI